MMIARCCVLVCLLVGAVWARQEGLDDLWVQYMAEYGKAYTTEEELYRFCHNCGGRCHVPKVGRICRRSGDICRNERQVWEDNIDKIRQHNLEQDLGMHNFALGINEYADLTFDEYRSYMLGARQDLQNAAGDTSRLVFTADSERDVPDTVDWRDKGYVTPVKNQGQCGSCWAFSSTGAMEGAHFKATGQLISLSEQQLVDCCKTNAGCGGGWMDNAFKYVQDNGGIDTETYYPYQARATGRCTYNPNDKGAEVGSFVDVTKGDEEALKQAVATQGPIAVAIDASHQSFQMYKSGVYFEPKCSSTTTDHAVLVVGYGTDDGQDYWLVKNSWGTTWGIEGYIKMARNYSNQCAIASYASYPTDPE